MLVGQLVMIEEDLNDDKKQALNRFFNTSLSRDPNIRESGLRQFLNHLISKQ